jgi:phosphate transport system substrate-binding protein
MAKAGVNSVMAVAATLALVAACGPGAGAGAGNASTAGTAAPSGQIAIVGSSTVFPFATAVAEQFASRGAFSTPRVESTGTGGGIAIFCRGGASAPDIVNASRPMKKSEFEACQAGGVNSIVEVRIGFDGIVLANAKGGPSMDITKAQLVQALAAEIPQGATFVPNPHQNWSDVAPGLPAVKIDVLGPPPTSGTRDAFNELALEKGARDIPELAALRETDEDAFKARATTLREDGSWKDGGENDNLIVQALSRSPNQFGVFGFSFFEENMDRMQAVTIGGVVPTFEAIASGEYPVSRSLYLYVNAGRVGVTPGLKEFLQEFVSDRSAGPQGYLRARGMVPLPAADLTAVRATVDAMTPMAAPEK